MTYSMTEAAGQQQNGGTPTLPTGASYVYAWDTIKGGTTTIPAGTVIVASGGRVFATKQAIAPNAAVRNIDPGDFDSADGKTYFESTHLEDVLFNRSTGGEREYTFGEKNDGNFRETEICFVLDVSNNAIDRALKISETEGIVLIKKKTDNNPPAVDAFDSSTYDATTLIGSLNGTPEVGANLVALDALKVSNSPTDEFVLSVVGSTLKWLKVVQPKDLFDEETFWDAYRNTATLDDAGQWNFLNASNAIVGDLVNTAFTTTQLNTVAFMQIHEDVWGTSDFISGDATKDISTRLDTLLNNGGVLYIHNTNNSNYGTIPSEYLTVTIASTGSSKTGSIYKLAVTSVTQTGTVYNENSFYAFNADLIGVQKVQANQLVDVQTLFAKVLTVQDTDQLLTMDGNGVLGNIRSDTILSRYVEIADLVGDDTADFYGAFQPASGLLHVDTINKRGSWCIATNASDAPTTSDSANQESINDGNYTLVIAATMSNSDWTFKSAAYAASDFESGDILYAHPYDPYDADNYYKMTLTGNATLVGSGNAAYLYMPVTVDEVGNIDNPSDGWRLTETPPTNLLAGLRSRLPVSGNLPTLAQTTKLLLSNFEEVSIAHLGEHIIPQTTEERRFDMAWETLASTVGSKNNRIAIQNAILGGISQLILSFPDSISLEGGGSIPIADVESILNGHHQFTCFKGTIVYKGTITGFLRDANTGNYYINLKDATYTGGTFADGDTVKILLESNLIARDEISKNAFIATEPKFTDWTPTLENITGADTFTQNWIEYEIVEYSDEKRVRIRLDITASHSSNSNFSALRFDLPAVPDTGTTPTRVTCFGNPIDSNFKRMQCGIISNKIRVVVEKQANDGNSVNFNAEIHYKTAA